MPWVVLLICIVHVSHTLLPTPQAPKAAANASTTDAEHPELGAPDVVVHDDPLKPSEAQLAGMEAFLQRADVRLSPAERDMVRARMEQVRAHILSKKTPGH